MGFQVFHPLFMNAGQTRVLFGTEPAGSHGINECNTAGFDVRHAMTVTGGCDPGASSGPGDDAWLARVIRFGLVLGLHGLLLTGILHARQPLPEAEPEPIRFAVRVIELPAAAQEPPVVMPAPPMIPPSPPPVARRPAPKRQANPAPVAVVPVPPPMVAVPESAPTAPAPATVTAVRFDAAYLNNPAPAYPILSRRRGEQGRVLLRVRVNARGLPEQVEVHQGSGHARLDQAALDAVRRWRFVAARRGDTAISASVLVPIEFQLDR